MINRRSIDSLPQELRCDVEVLLEQMLSVHSMLESDGQMILIYCRRLLSSSDSLVVSFPDLSSGLG